ncbi:fungal-specific transcription factor domain-containing protein [Mycena crocata]|nr:fungal-specific transcription factor domain-containing protein [Mycena crocata]
MPDEDLGGSVPKGKRRRLQGSCDECRKKKVKCDSAEMPGNLCTNCICFKLHCTHDRAKARGAKNTPVSFSERLKTAQEHVENILSTSTIYIPSDDPHTSHQLLVEVALYARSLEEKLSALELLASSTVSTPTIDVTPSSEISEASDTENFAAPGDFSLGAPETGLISLLSKTSPRFVGQSSSVSFAKAAMKQLQGNPEHTVGVRRPEFWTPQPWKKLNLAPPQHSFPEDDLLNSLVKIYFDQINPLIGILHSPSFRQSLTDGLHLRDSAFGAVVLAVCSLASRYSDDPRVFLDEANSEHSCGWKWFQQVRPLRTSFSPEPSLQQIQLICLSTLYLAGTAAPEEVWILTGLGIRFAQAAGAHHRSEYQRMEPLEAELYKRVFWMMVVTDTIESSFRGRPGMSSIASLDLELPLDCDEEQWSLPNPVQPIGKPSSGAFMVAFLRLMMIFERIQGAYPTDEQIYYQEVVTDLDSELNRWIELIPAHLRWNLDQENQVFLDQSAALYAMYYHAQIMIHRPFIPGPGKQAASSTNFPSLAICANAARSCGHVLDVQTRRGRGLLFQPGVITALFDSAIVLLINVWSIIGGRNSLKDFKRATADVQNCVRVMRLYERRWRVAGRRADILTAMLNIGKYTSSTPSLKRPRDNVDAPISQPSPFPDAPEPRPIAGSSRVMSPTQQIEALELSIQETDHLFSLPLHTDELGRLPIYNSFDYEFPAQSDNLHYQPQSHWHDQMEPEFIHGFDPVIDSMLQVEGSGTGESEMPSSNSFEIPSGDGWRDWSAYLANLEGLNSATF